MSDTNEEAEARRRAAAREAAAAAAREAAAAAAREAAAAARRAARWEQEQQWKDDRDAYNPTGANGAVCSDPDDGGCSISGGRTKRRRKSRVTRKHKRRSRSSKKRR